MQISQQGLQKIIQREGVILHAYQDIVGVWTIGTGHTTAAGSPEVHPGMVITKEQNDEILKDDLKPIEEQFTKYVHVQCTQNQYDAIISIVFNVGPKFWHSTAIQRLNTGDVKGAASAIMLWNKPKEIIGRRHTEMQQFLTPDTETQTEVKSSPNLPSLDDVNNEVTTATGLWTTLKEFFKDNFKTNIPVAAGSIAALFSNNWPYIVAGTIIFIGLAWFGFYLYERKING